MILTSSPLQSNKNNNHNHNRISSSSLLSLPSQPRMKPATSAICGDSFIEHVNRQFLSPFSTSGLLALSTELHKCYVDAASTSDAQMLPSHITTLPSGHERGQYLAVDLGGTNMRVALVRLQDNEATVQKLDKSTIPEAVKTGTAREFFNWIAEKIVNLVGQSTLDEGEYEWKLGVTWSFPFSYTSL
jgi:hexokinase